MKVVLLEIPSVISSDTEILTTPPQPPGNMSYSDAVTGEYNSTSKGSFKNSNMVKIHFTHILDVTLACDDDQSSPAHRVIILASSSLFSEQF